jgi:regulator of sirC expression with transglutaminase-like and TPR domain
MRFRRLWRFLLATHRPWSLQGFVHAARNENQRALGAFDQAIALDPALPTAWIGRGLVRIRIGRTIEGRQDLQAAAALNPEQACCEVISAKRSAKKAAPLSPAKS